MKPMNSKLLVLGTAALFLLQAAPVSALSLGAALDNSTQAEVGDGAAVRSQTSVDANADVSADSSAGVGADIATGPASAEIAANSDAQTSENMAAVVTVTHPVRGLLFGLIPITLDVTALVNQNGTVTLTYPWFGFLVSTDASLQASVQRKVQGILGTGTGATLSASGKAQLESAVASALGDLSTSGAATTSGSLNTQ